MHNERNFHGLRAESGEEASRVEPGVAVNERCTYIRPPVARYCFCLIVKQDGWKINCKPECVFRFVRLNGTWEERERERDGEGKAEEKAERTGWPHTGIQLPRRKTRILYHARATASDFQ